MAGGAVVLQADPWGQSDVSAATLQSLVDDGLLRPVTDPNRPEWIAPGNEPEPRPHDGYIMSFVAASVTSPWATSFFGSALADAVPRFLSLSLLSSPFSLLLPSALFHCSWQPLEGRKRECRQKR